MIEKEDEAIYRPASSASLDQALTPLDQPLTPVEVGALGLDNQEASPSQVR